jgi:hypothetical protein
MRIVDRTSPPDDFLLNSNNSNRMNCNHLVAQAALAAALTVTSSMKKRVTKTGVVHAQVHQKVIPTNLIVRWYAHLKVKLWFMMLPYD